MLVGFLGAALVAAILAALMSDPERLRRVLLRATGVALIGLPVVRLLTGGPGWVSALDGGLVTVPAFDLGLLLGGVLCLRSARRSGALACAEASTARDPDKVLA